jgi:hypothetical protein
VLFGVSWGVSGCLMILLELHEKAGEQLLPFSFMLWGVWFTHGSKHSSSW